MSKAAAVSRVVVLVLVFLATTMLQVWFLDSDACFDAGGVYVGRTLSCIGFRPGEYASILRGGGTITLWVVALFFSSLSVLVIGHIWVKLYRPCRNNQ